jgi:hypothetical protein
MNQFQNPKGKTRFAYPSLPSGSSFDWKRLSARNITIPNGRDVGAGNRSTSMKMERLNMSPLGLDPGRRPKKLLSENGMLVTR